MAQSFDLFVKDFQTALKNGDEAFVRRVYQHWVDTSGALPDECRDSFPELVIGEMGSMAELPVKATETFDDFGIVQFADDSDPDSTISLTFKQVDGDWILFNERSNFTKFRKVYTLWYLIEGGRAAIRLNGKRHPLISEPDEDSCNATISPINSGLEVGANQVNLVHISGTPEVQLRITSGEEGEISDSTEGDVLQWDGTVTTDVTLDFSVE